MAVLEQEVFLPSHLALQLRNTFGPLGLCGLGQLGVEALREAPPAVLPVLFLRSDTRNMQIPISEDAMLFGLHTVWCLFNYSSHRWTADSVVLVSESSHVFC